jgi:isoleucyl-tRNA synthetase
MLCQQDSTSRQRGEGFPISIFQLLETTDNLHVQTDSISQTQARKKKEIAEWQKRRPFAAVFRVPNSPPPFPTTSQHRATQPETKEAKMPHFPMDTGFESSAGAGASVNADVPDEKQRSVQIKNRRKRYLDQHPEYFSAELELAGPLAL